MRPATAPGAGSDGRIPQREVSRSAGHRCSTIRLANRRPKMKPYDARLTAFTPKLVTVLGEGYTFDRLRRDSISGLTVAIVALTLAMALAIASGAQPGKGLTTAVHTGFPISSPWGLASHVGGAMGRFV